MENLYFIQLFDQNCPGIVSGVTHVFVEDIEEFAKIYQSMERDQARVERFLRSKNGEVVSDYYSDAPDLNIVQRGSVEDLGEGTICKKAQRICTESGFGWPSYYFFLEIQFQIRWIKFQDKYYKLVKPSGKGCCEKSDFDVVNPFKKIEIVGNPFWIYKEEPGIPWISHKYKDYEGTALESYVWQVAEIFETEEEMKADQEMLGNSKLSEEQIVRVFADLPGEGG